MSDTSESEQNWYSEAAATFGDRVAGAREAAGMNQQDLARRLGVKLKTLRGWEDDLSEPRANKLQMLSGVLNVSLMWLLNGEGDGIGAPDETVLGGVDAGLDTGAVLAEVRALKSSLSKAAERAGRLEKTLLRASPDHDA